jgi:4a-hydroxytetrahydrobiopterin dehydratase
MARGFSHSSAIAPYLVRSNGFLEPQPKESVMTAKEHAYSENEIAERLARDLPHWRYENGWIRRKFKTHSWKGTLMVINAVGHLAEAAWHHPDIAASYAWVEVKLMTHTAKGITDKDFELARKVEEVVGWRPGKQGGALEGTPENDLRFAYLKYDD